MKPISRRSIPSVDRVLRELGQHDLPRPAAVALVRRELAQIRKSGKGLEPQQVIARIRAALDELCRTRIQPVINGTGVLVHTNLGRAPLAAEAQRALEQVAANYCNLEYDLTSGQRGGRAAYLEHNLAVLCGAQAATVVNNCAAALVLVLRHFAKGERNEVVISRGELIQIGGGFRIPEILEASGAALREVGTTNKTKVGDYARALGKQTALILLVHRSNFYMSGFVESPPIHELVELARKKRVPIAQDLGSGAVIRTERIAPIEHEPTPSEVLASGVDLVCFSGDKLLGGPQAGIIAGRARLVAALKRDPLFRALRCDKLILSALQSTVDLHLSWPESLPIAAMLRESNDALARRAQAIADRLTGLPLHVTIGTGKAQVGGGTLPRSVIPSVTLDLLPTETSLEELSQRLRSGQVPVIAYISGGKLKIDLRTVFARQDEQLAAAVGAALRPELILPSPGNPGEGRVGVGPAT